MQKLHIQYVFIVLMLFSLLYNAQGQGTIFFVNGQTFDTAPGGFTTSTVAACEVVAGCTGHILFSLISASAFSDLACPNHFVENNAQGGWNQVDTVNANALAMDLFNGYVRGSSFAQEGCNTPPISTANSNTGVCNQPSPIPSGGGGGRGNCFGDSYCECLYEEICGPPGDAPEVVIKKTMLSDADLPKLSALNQEPESSYVGIGALLSQLPDSVKQSTYLLKNSSNRTLAAYVIQWTGNVQGKETAFFQGYDELDLMGNPQRPVSGFGMEPNASRILNPTFNLHPNEAAEAASDKNYTKRLLSQPSNDRMQGGAIFTPVLDLVIFADGSFAGADQAGLKAKLVADKQAQHDVALSIVKATHAKATAQQIEANLQALASSGANSSDPYTLAQARWAGNFLRIYQRLGVQGLSSSSKQLASLKRLRLGN